jgi:hypothetical protein
MGRGHRGGGPAGRPGRGGRRAGGGGGARGHGGSRPGQPSATIPAGEALLVELRASPGFHEALKGRGGAPLLPTSLLHELHWPPVCIGAVPNFQFIVPHRRGAHFTAPCRLPGT